MSDEATAKAHRVGEPLKSILTTTDMAALLGVSLDRIYQLAADLEPFELKPRLGRRARYSGQLVQRWLEGQEPPSTEPSRYFAAGRRAAAR